MKEYKEIGSFKSMEMTFTIEDADLDKLHDVLKDINVRECPWFEVQDKHGNKAKYYREPQWIPCSERMPEENLPVLVAVKQKDRLPKWVKEQTYSYVTNIDVYDDGDFDTHKNKVVAWMPLPEPYEERKEQ